MLDAAKIWNKAPEKIITSTHWQHPKRHSESIASQLGLAIQSNSCLKYVKCIINVCRLCF
jgi:hypothetical protein